MIHRFGAFEIDEQLFELRKNGEPVPIPPKAFDILKWLIKNRNVVVSRAELMAKVWPGVAVTNDSVAQAISLARAAIGDDGEQPTFIQTVRGRGYRFVGVIEPGANASLPQAKHPPETKQDAPAPVAKPGSNLVGRATSLTTLRELRERARAGRGSVCLVTGESGVGKTRLVEELCADTAGVEPIFVRCYEGDDGPELWPFTQALRILRGAGASIDGDVAALADSRLDAAVLAAPATRFALMDATVRALTSFAAQTPLLLAIDDLHLADLDTLRLIALLAPQLRSAKMLFVAAYTPTAPRLPSFRAAMGALAQEPTTSTVRLEPLTREEAGTFVEQALGRPLGSALIDKIFDKAKGNPLLLSQLVHVLSAETKTKLDAGELVTSALVGGDAMREAITSMLASLPDSVNRVLTVASVFGTSFPIAPLAAALGTTNELVLHELDRADTARVVARDGAASYRFTYPLVRDVLYKRLLASERARLHAAVAAALGLQLGNVRDHRRAGEIADHLVEAAAAGDVEAAVDGSLRAAELARAEGDHTAAAKYAKRGLDAFRFAQSPDETRRAQLRVLSKLDRR